MRQTSPHWRNSAGYAFVVAGTVTWARITCPACGFAKDEVMPLDACVQIYDCSRCGAKLSPKPGDCCVFCSYSDSRCPPKQAGA
jgi:hypothetical protein